MKKTNINFDMASAAKVASRVNLQSVSLLACECKQQPKHIAGPKDFDIKRASRFQFEKEQKAIGVFIKFALSAFGEGEERKKENAFLDIKATFFLMYSLTDAEDLDDKALGSFADLNGTYNAWPYWREFVQNITSRMSMAPLTIPVFKLPCDPSRTGTAQKRVKVETVVKK